ncbi:beta-barrel assembly machinery complex, BamD/YfiO lipoprotein [Campylobacter sp. RM5004]|uniref:outer membrane protein assembly factor BamD n=1 Tax=Campylobacter sp. RM5004 TaxID=1660078 RepID=UPI001EFAA3E9|nr:outer membrane protein assembly factor BamD [Campylobacter sp. RM5004]ULO02225.1 beta-barrel assembly machinery complex, BamD/YfiO lipoprotein [Campylobacter sp. RM5004]
MKKLNIFLLILSLLCFSACASKKEMFDDYNLSDSAWLEKIIESVKKNDLEKADSEYISLYSEHINSPLLASAMLILSQAHAKEHEYLLANYYIDEYIKLYGNSNNYEWLSYLKIKNNFNAFSLPNRNQYLLNETLKEIDAFLFTNKNSQYSPLVNSIKTKLNLTKLMLETDIRDLYRRMGHDISESVYDEKIKNNELNDIKYIKPRLPWYRKLFESSYAL